MAFRSMRALLHAAAAGLALVSGALPALAQETVLIPNRVVYPGETVSADALKEVTLKPGKQAPEAVAVTLAELEGKVAKRTLLTGRYIPLSSLREAYLVEQGAAVEVVFVSGALTISASAVTLEPGSAGDLVKVRNIDSGKILSGTVMADGSIRVGAT
ncbi:flagellar basal body P-ring formation chaperone FlgA [Allomesorhizobium camelthorni]|uniref:Flagella basal body P-ring formation protein FlgA n=1 Tax=Allomesorhizobium camelthorni TaxID=475069 RepID=A0A6G4WKN5_9HYPH|nr:flagellar basal body P-ring formation chaperone FlgA [Mesorhizobium camelthorni]NGO55372.1 flagellar basal body P-ring formation protein FlgA [Mesorhizobium camelthorni]